MGDATRVQGIDIFYDLVGMLPVSLLYGLAHNKGTGAFTLAPLLCLESP